MDLFTGDDFPGHVAPFPETSDFLYAEPTALVHPPQIITHGHGHNLPPQKLRPIRCNGRLSPVSQVAELPENGGLVGTPLCSQNMESSDVDYFSNQLCVANGESSLDFDCVENQGEASEVLKKKDCGDVAENTCLQMEDHVRSGSGSGDVAKFWDSKIIESFLEQDSSCSSDGDYDSLRVTKEPGSAKRGEKTMKKLEDYVENLAMKVMEKQEQMHKQLVDMIEKKEKERLMREEAWKQKEMERIKREEEARAQEKSRNLALISFIQNLLGREIEIPEPVSIFREGDEAEANIQKDFKSDPSSNRWPEAEVQALITLRTSLESKFRLMGSKGSIWGEISEAMNNMGYNRSAKKCKEKWENINKYYKRTMGSGKKRRLSGKACPYFDELDILYRNGLLNPGNALSDTDNIAKIEKD
ncbi:hypothetical protein L6164_036042 [Bauhinia variegata]|uniref:Uncharacterized protein n=1 Tax=Bauhinia variegata TaxID=167791 RepID=A0ACB9KGK8_BAUVA|nr:hypothetical protein L6164_036042 [Bauhinia variegata]